MIVLLRGTVAFARPDALVVDVSGVGYEVHVPASVAAAVGGSGGDITLHTRMRVSDSDITLYGATDPEAMRLFDELVSVSGVGPRIAMAMLSTFDTSSLANAIVAEDADLITRAPGVGRKTAQRLVLELKSKIADLAIATGAGGAPPSRSTADDDYAVQALLGLGYSSGEARRALAASALAEDAPLEERLRAALRWLSG